MMKNLIIAMSFSVMSLMAADYSALTIDELNAMRGTIAVEDRDAFRTEMQSRIATMTSDELATFRADRMANGGAGPKDGSGAGSLNKGSKNQGQGMGQRLKDGSGAGSMSQGANSGRGKNAHSQGGNR